jgi:hypothetical protein
MEAKRKQVSARKQSYEFLRFDRLFGVLQSNVGHLHHFGGALCALLFLPVIFFFAPTNSAMRRIISTEELPSKLKLVAELAVFLAGLVALFLFIEHLHYFPEIDLSKSLSDIDL